MRASRFTSATALIATRRAQFHKHLGIFKMAGVKGRSGTNKGKDKPFADALRMEIAAAGDNQKALRKIASKALALAEAGDMQAINFVADRLDGKPMQSVDMTTDTTIRYVARVPDKKANAQTWQDQHAPEQKTLQ